MHRRTSGSELGAAAGSFMGVALTDVLHLIGYLPYLVIAVTAAAGAIVDPLIFDRKKQVSDPPGSWVTLRMRQAFANARGKR